MNATQPPAAPQSNVTSVFGLALLQQEASAAQGKNVLVSPASVAIALAMTLNGAREKTLTALKTTLGFSEEQSVEAINGSLSAIISGITDANLGVVLNVANAIWAEKSVAFKPDFFERTASAYQAQINNADFGNCETVAAMNDWASQQTKGTIPEIISEISPDMVMYLLNAVYFKGSWTNKFDRQLTTTKTFHGEKGDEPAEMMFRNGDMRLSWSDNYQALALPFGDNKRVHLYVILPEAGSDINNFVSQIDTSILSNIKASTYTSEVNLTLPRFEVEYNVDLIDSLCALGMAPACQVGADFSGMADASLVISTVKHKTFAKFDEEGGEAAAVTAVGVALECFQPVLTFTVDRPFVIALVDEGTDTLLLIGKIASTKRL